MPRQQHGGLHIRLERRRLQLAHFDRVEGVARSADEVFEIWQSVRRSSEFVVMERQLSLDSVSSDEDRVVQHPAVLFVLDAGEK